MCRPPQLSHNSRVNSRVHPKYKTKYRVGNWPAYELALVQRGDVTLWLSDDAMAAWRPAPSGLPGGPRKYSDLAIETALTLRLVFRLPLRQTEGFLRSIFGLMHAGLAAPDHTTLSRRSRRLDLALDRIAVQEPLHLVVDSTGLSVFGEGEWAAAKHGGGGERGWEKLHLGVDRTGVIVTHALTEPTADDATTGVGLVEHINGDVARVTADAACGHHRVLRRGQRATRDGRGAACPNGVSVSTRTSVQRPQSDDQARAGPWTSTLDEGLGIPSTGARGERRLSVQIDHRSWAESPVGSRASDRDLARVQHLESDDGPWSACVLQHRKLKCRSAGSLRVKAGIPQQRLEQASQVQCRRLRASSFSEIATVASGSRSSNRSWLSSTCPGESTISNVQPSRINCSPSGPRSFTASRNVRRESLSLSVSSVDFFVVMGDAPLWLPH